MSRWRSCKKKAISGRRKITQWTRYVTVLLGVVQSAAIAIALQSSSSNLVLHPGIGFVLMTVLTLTAGTTFIMWLGEQITERGIGNGMSLLIFAGIVVGLPRGIADLYQTAKSQRFGAMTIPALILLVAGMIAVVAFIVYVEKQRTAHSGAVRQAHCRTPPDGRTVDAPAPQGELRRRDAGHLCGLGAVGADALLAGKVRAEQPVALAHL